MNIHLHLHHHFDEAQLVRMMHDRGLRPSMHRVAALAVVANSALHPTADEVYARLHEVYPTMSKTTVYNSLHALSAVGLIRPLEVEAANCRYDFAPQEPHSHFICRKCGRVFDFEMPRGVQCFESAGFASDSVDVVFRGICPDCREQ